MKYTTYVLLFILIAFKPVLSNGSLLDIKEAIKQNKVHVVDSILKQEISLTLAEKNDLIKLAQEVIDQKYAAQINENNISSQESIKSGVAFIAAGTILLAIKGVQVILNPGNYGINYLFGELDIRNNLLHDNLHTNEEDQFHKDVEVGYLSILFGSNQISKKTSNEIQKFIKTIEYKKSLKIKEMLISYQIN